MLFGDSTSPAAVNIKENGMKREEDSRIFYHKFRFAGQPHLIRCKSWSNIPATNEVGNL